MHMHARHAAATLGAIALAASLFASTSGGVAADTPDQDQHFTFQKIADPADPTFTQLLGINDHRVIAGYHTNTPGNKGFTLKLPASFTDENFSQSAQTQVVGINNNDKTVGFYIDQGGTNHGFVKPNGKTAKTVDLPGTTFNQLLGINNKNQAAGYYQDAQGLQHGYVHEADGSFLVLNIPMPSDQATGINDQGDVVGFMQTSPAATSSDGFLLHDGQLKKIDYPKATFTQALGINNRGDIVGVYNDANGMTHGFEYRDGSYMSIDVPGASSTTVNGINNEGMIVGFFQDPNQNNNTTGLVGEPRS
jgi:probable HAF family extracellular repeat protein